MTISIVNAINWSWRVCVCVFLWISICKPSQIIWDSLKTNDTFIHALNQEAFVFSNNNINAIRQSNVTQFDYKLQSVQK